MFVHILCIDGLSFRYCTEFFIQYSGLDILRSLAQEQMFSSINKTICTNSLPPQPCLKVIIDQLPATNMTL